MKKNDTANSGNTDVWNETAKPVDPQAKPLLKTQPIVDPGYDMEGLMTDFPTATELAKFVFDETGIALNLKGRANKLKYQVALETLNGHTPAAEFVSKENPYVDKNDMVPMEDVKILPERDRNLPPLDSIQNYFHTAGVPHTDPERRAAGAKISVCFRKYMNGTITYEIEGPLEQKPYGEKIDKFGRQRPEIIKWIDPRTPETLIVRPDGSTTPTGQRLRALLKSMPVNKSSVWDTWVDREFVTVNQSAIDNPWGMEGDE